MPADNKTGAVDPRAYLKDHGTAVNVLTPDQIKQFRNKTESVYDKWTKIIGADLIDLAKKDMASVR